jgi:hypothetical protein
METVCAGSEVLLMGLSTIEMSGAQVVGGGPLVVRDELGCEVPQAGQSEVNCAVELPVRARSPSLGQLKFLSD